MIHWLAHKLGLRGCPDCDMLVEYALEGLPGQEQEKVRRHLSGCPMCMEQVRDFLQVNEALGLCAPEQEPSCDLSAKVLARLHETDMPPRGTPEMPERRRHLGGWPRFWMIMGPLFAGMSLLMTVVAFAALLGHKNAAGAGTDNEMADITNAILRDPRAAQVTLVSAGAAAGASGRLVLCPGMDHAYVRCDHLSRCPLGRNYALWMSVPGAEPRRLARFEVDKDGSSVHLLQLDGAFNASGPVDFSVTQESGTQAGETWLKGSVKL